MKNTATLALALAAATGLSATAAIAADNSGGRVFPLKAQNGSGEMGTVALKPRGDKTVVEVHLVGAGDDVAQPAHIHQGTCSKLNPAPKYPLTSVTHGVSETTVDVPMAAITKGGYAINVHKSASDLKDYVACGNLYAPGGYKKMMMKDGASKM